MKTPKTLPWYARRAGVSDARAEQLWADAIRYATVRVGWVGTPEYWRIAMEQLLALLEAEAQTLRRAARSSLPIGEAHSSTAGPGSPPAVPSQVSAPSVSGSIRCGHCRLG